MLQVAPQHRILLAVSPLDFRKGIESIRALCQQELQRDPFSGTLFVFTNRPQTSIKILVYDGNGFWLLQKRFSQGKLKWWPKSTDSVCQIRASELQIILSQGEPIKADIPEQWRRLPES